MTKVTLASPNELIKKFGLEPGGRVQRYIDNAVLTHSEPYIPKASGRLISSGQATGTGTVSWNTPYAAKQYYSNRGNGLRGNHWFDRMKADRGADIIAGAKQAASGKS